MATASKDIIGKLFAVFFPVMAFVASGFEHSVANMFFIPYGILLKSVPQVVAATGKTLADFAGLNWVTLWTKNLIPVTIGNIIGGAFFVGFIYWFVYLKKAPETVEAK
jgi:formate/nitrite transporter FocA (FNT family)